MSVILFVAKTHELTRRTLSNRCVVHSGSADHITATGFAHAVYGYETYEALVNHLERADELIDRFIAGVARLNARAYNARYRGENAQPIELETIRATPIGFETWSDVDLYRQLSSYVYNCAEAVCEEYVEDVPPEDAEAFQRIERARDYVARTIVNSLPEHEISKVWA